MENEETWKPYPEFDFIEGSSLGNVRAIGGHYSLDIYGKLFNNRASLYDDSEKMLEDIFKNQDLYSSNLKSNGLNFEVDTQTGPLPADPLDSQHYFTEIHVKIDRGGE